MSKKSFNNNPSLAYITTSEQKAEEQPKKQEPTTVKITVTEHEKQEPKQLKIVYAEESKQEQPGQRQAPKKYMRLDITDYQEYISLMAAYTSKTTGKYISMTQYIQRLIEEDRRKNKELYDKLEQIEKLKADII